METPKHATIVSHTPQDDGSIKIDTKSYYDKLATHKEEREYRHKTDRKKLLADLVMMVAPLLDRRTDTLVLEFTTDQYREPSLIKQRYTVYKENFGKRV